MQTKAVLPALFCLLLVASGLGAQQVPGTPLDQFLNGNDRLAMKLLAGEQKQHPGQNAAVAPLSITLVLGALENNLEREEGRTEIRRALGWDSEMAPAIPAKILLATEQLPEPPTRLENGKLMKPAPWDGAALWTENRLLYRRPASGRSLLTPWFVKNAEHYFGLKPVAVSGRNPIASDLAASRSATGAQPAVAPGAEVWLSSGAHLRQAWGPTFQGTHERSAGFTTEEGQTKQVTVINSDLWQRPYLKTAKFEAAALPCGAVSVVLVLPREGMKLGELEELLGAHPESLKAMKPQLGSVTLPLVHIRATLDLKEQLERLGVHDIFNTLEGVVRDNSRYVPKVGTVAAPLAWIESFQQKIDLIADREGVRADAETIAGMAVFGVMGAAAAFQLDLNRPFLLLVREPASGALLFAAAVLDPSQVAQ